MFHLDDNLFFGRRADGSVRILKFAEPPHGWPQADDEHPAASFDTTIDANGWASIVSSVSAGGEDGGRFYTAREFHGDEGDNK